VARRIGNEGHGISRVTYDISGKPPATVQWEQMLVWFVAAANVAGKIHRVMKQSQDFDDSVACGNPEHHKVTSPTSLSRDMQTE